MPLYARAGKTRDGLVSKYRLDGKNVRTPRDIPTSSDRNIKAATVARHSVSNTPFDSSLRSPTNVWEKIIR